MAPDPTHAATSSSSSEEDMDDAASTETDGVIRDEVIQEDDRRNGLLNAVRSSFRDSTRSSNVSSSTKSLHQHHHSYPSGDGWYINNNNKSNNSRDDKEDEDDSEVAKNLNRSLDGLFRDGGGANYNKASRSSWFTRTRSRDSVDQADPPLRSEGSNSSGNRKSRNRVLGGGSGSADSEDEDIISINNNNSKDEAAYDSALPPKSEVEVITDDSSDEFFDGVARQPPKVGRWRSKSSSSMSKSFSNSIVDPPELDLPLEASSNGAAIPTLASSTSGAETTIAAEADCDASTVSAVYRARGEEALNYICQGLEKITTTTTTSPRRIPVIAIVEKDDLPSSKHTKLSSHRASSSTVQTTPPPPQRKPARVSRNRSAGSCSTSGGGAAPLSASKRFRRTSSSCSDGSLGHRGRVRRERPYYGLSNRRTRENQVTSSTSRTNSFAISTVKPAPVPVYQQYIHDRVHGHSFVPRDERANLKSKKKDSNKKKNNNNNDTNTMKKLGKDHESKSSSSSLKELDEEVEVSKEADFVSEAFVINGDNVSRVFRSIMSFADSDRPDRDDEEEDPTDCMNRPPHFLCYLPPCVARWPGLLEQNRFCEYVGRIGLHDGFKNQRIARRRIFAVGFTFNLFALILLVAASMALSRDHRLLSRTSFAKGKATIPNFPPFYLDYSNASSYEYYTNDVTEVATLYMGFRALTSDDGILVDPESVLFTTFCRGFGLTSVSSGIRGHTSRNKARTQEDAFKQALAPEICGSCTQSSQGFVISCVFNIIFIIKNMFSDVTRMYPKYDLNCPNFAGSLMATLSVFLGLYTILSYRSRCFTTLTKDLSDFGYIGMSDKGDTTMSFLNSTLFLIPDDIRENWQGHEADILVHLEWEAGPGLWCMWIATALKMVDAVCNFIVPTPSITRDFHRREDYEYEFGEPGLFIDDEEDVDDDDEDDENEEEDDLDQTDMAVSPRRAKDDEDEDDENFYDEREEDTLEVWETTHDRDTSSPPHEGELPGVVLLVDHAINDDVGSSWRSDNAGLSIQQKTPLRHLDSDLADELPVLVERIVPQCPLPSFDGDSAIRPVDSDLAGDTQEKNEGSRSYTVQGPYCPPGLYRQQTDSDISDDDLNDEVQVSSPRVFMVQDPCFSNGRRPLQHLDPGLPDKPKEYGTAQGNSAQPQGHDQYSYRTPMIHETMHEGYGLTSELPKDVTPVGGFSQQGILAQTSFRDDKGELSGRTEDSTFHSAIVEL
ncbi:hypothetical protein ACA910_004290 [Epithemia clementina (nom. ined.)]